MKRSTQRVPLRHPISAHKLHRAVGGESAPRLGVGQRWGLCRTRKSHEVGGRAPVHRRMIRSCQQLPPEKEACGRQGVGRAMCVTGPSSVDWGVTGGEGLR